MWMSCECIVFTSLPCVCFQRWNVFIFVPVVCVACILPISYIVVCLWSVCEFKCGPVCKCVIRPLRLFGCLTLPVALFRLLQETRLLMALCLSELQAVTLAWIIHFSSLMLPLGNDTNWAKSLSWCVMVTSMCPWWFTSGNSLPAPLPLVQIVTDSDFDLAC